MKARAHLPIAAILLLSLGNTTAQETQKCGADELRIHTLRNRPEVAEAVIRRDAELERFTADFRSNGETRGGDMDVYLIPVVFHVIHRNGDENISDAQLMDGIRVCNETLRKTYPDTADIIEAFQPIHADCGIELRLATRDPEGNCHSGINRIASSLSATGDHAVKSLVHWDPTRYLNVYVTNSAAGLAGHAVWPSDADTIPEWDGIVLAHTYVGAIGTSNQTRSVVFAHEVGHYLNLHHIWGGNNVPDFYYLPVAQAVNCEHDDLVDDTPNTIGWQNCALSAASCGNEVDNVQNAMDYSYCNIMFTEGQRDRMRACLNAPIAGRNNLWTEENLITTGVLPETGQLCQADFAADRTTVCPNTDNQVTFTNTSFHGEPDSLRWMFPGGMPSTSTQLSPVVTYGTPGLHDVTLRAYRDGTMAEKTRTGFISVISDQQVPHPFLESFEDIPALDGAPWAVGSADGQSRWQLTEDAAAGGTRSVSVNLWNENSLTMDELYGPSTDLTSAQGIQFAFKYAFSAASSPSSTDRLQFQVSRNCETSWVSRLNISGENLLTAPVQDGPFIPTSEEWRQEVLNIPSLYLTEGFRFRFLFTTEGGSRLFIDDINIDFNASAEEIGTGREMHVFPNPTKELLTVRIGGNASVKATLSVRDILGREVLHAGQHTFGKAQPTHQLNVSGLPAGMYVVQLRSAQDMVSAPFIIH